MHYRQPYFITTSEFLECLPRSLKLLNLQVQFRNPVMFVTFLGAIAATIYVLAEGTQNEWNFFHIQISIWLWLTVLFANFAQSIAENRGKAHLALLRNNQTDVFSNLIKDGKKEKVLASELKKGDIVLCEVGDIIPAEGEVLEGVATVDESAITGESAPVIRESGNDRNLLTAGTKIISGRLKILVTAEISKSFFDHMQGMIEGKAMQKSPNEIALQVLLSAITIIYLIIVFSLSFFVDYTLGKSSEIVPLINFPVLIALLVCLIPNTISALLRAIRIGGKIKLINCHVIVKNGRCLEAIADIDLLIIDKTGTLTMGNRIASVFLAASGIGDKDFAEIAQLASFCDDSSEGRSITMLAKKMFGSKVEPTGDYAVVPFSISNRMSGINFLDSQGNVIRQIRKGAVDAVQRHIESLGNTRSSQTDGWVQIIANAGGTPILVSDNEKVVGVVHLQDTLKVSIKERFQEMRKMGIRTIMITGDNPLTAAAIAAEAGLDDFIAEATPEIKLETIKREQRKGLSVAMIGDGIDDAPALAQANVGVAMDSGTQVSKEAGNMIDLDSNPTKLINIVEIGKQQLMTRGILTIFSLTKGIVIYLAFIPALYSSLYTSYEGVGPLGILNVMKLHSPHSAILSGLIFNALIILLLMPLALKGVHCSFLSSKKILQKNVLLHGLSGIFAGFFGIKGIDIVIVFFNLV